MFSGRCRKSRRRQSKAKAYRKNPDSAKRSLPEINRGRNSIRSRAFITRHALRAAARDVCIDRRNKIDLLRQLAKVSISQGFFAGKLSGGARRRCFTPILLTKHAVSSSARSRGKAVEKFTWSFGKAIWRPPNISSLPTTYNKTFFSKFFTNRIDPAGRRSASLGFDRVRRELNKNQEYLALNTGTAIGRIHIIEKLDDTVEIGDNEILVLKELPLNLPPVRGIIVAKPSTPLSHINILAKGWGIPNVYIKNADVLFKEFDGRWVKFEANLTGYQPPIFADKTIWTK